MGLFRKIGRNVEEFSRSVKESADEAADYRCADCDEPYYTERETCSECGGDVHPVEPVEPTDAAESDASDRSTDEPDDGSESVPTEE